MAEVPYDLIIAGAGPAGCTAALRLAGSGLKILILERSVMPVHKICGDALSGTVMNVLKRLPGNCYEAFLDLEPKLPSWGIRFFAPSGESLDVPFVNIKKPDTPVPGFIIERKVFDQFLLNRISRFPDISLRENTPVLNIEREKTHSVLHAEKDTFRCRMILGADGVQSVIGRTLANHTPSPKSMCTGIRTYFEGVRDLHPEGFIELHFLKELSPGYFWIFPMMNGTANVGMGIPFSRSKHNQESLIKRFREIIRTHPALTERFADARESGKPGVHLLPLGPDPRPLSGDGFLLCGDAASLVDPFTGEGIGNAMLSGEIAADVIKEAFKCNDLSSSYLKKYDAAIRQKMFGEMRTSKRIQQLSGFAPLFNRVVAKANRNPEIREMLTAMYTNLSIRSKLKKPFFYWKILMG
jgi:menaquinone-9 beta-reductase